MKSAAHSARAVKYACHAPSFALMKRRGGHEHRVTDLEPLLHIFSFSPEREFFSAHLGFLRRVRNLTRQVLEQPQPVEQRLLAGRKRLRRGLHHAGDPQRLLQHGL